MRRRGLLLAAPLLMAAAWARGQTALGVVGVFSLLGDSVQVSAATDAPTDTRIERTARESLQTQGIGFDQIALRTARDQILRAHPASTAIVFRAPAPMTVAEQRAVAEGAARAELPDWMVKTLEENKLTHLLLVTRSRGTIDAKTGNGHTIGRGTVEGIGFFMDTLYKMRNLNTGAVSTGLLAPYVNIRLTLMDTRTAEVVRSYEIKDSFAYASPAQTEQADPWTFMAAADKVRTLRGLVEKGMARGMEQLLGKP